MDFFCCSHMLSATTAVVTDSFNRYSWGLAMFFELLWHGGTNIRSVKMSKEFGPVGGISSLVVGPWHACTKIDG